MNFELSIPMYLASGGGHDYLYGLFFLIVALVIGAATRHFLQKIPLPFTVLLLLIGLAMGALNRATVPMVGMDMKRSHRTCHRSMGKIHRYIEWCDYLGWRFGWAFDPICIFTNINI